MNSTIFVPIKRDYAVFNLKNNPFPYSGVPDTNPKLYIGQQESLTAVIQTISTTILTRKSNHLILTGPYGCGKSHTLLYIKEQLSTFTADDGTKPIVGYISQPGDKMTDIYREFMNNIGLERMQQYAREYIVRIATELFNEEKLETAISLPISWEDIVSGEILLSDIIPAALLRLNELTQYVDFCKAFINLVYDEEALSAWEWLTADGLDVDKRKIMKLSKNIDDKSVGRAFQALKSTLLELQYRPLILMIDEFEAIESFPINLKQKMLNSIRHLIDINGSDFTMIIACAPEVWQSLIAEYHAFSERIGKEMALKPLTITTMKDLIKAYLEQEILNPKEKCDPFEKAAYEAIFKQGLGNSRQILTLCGRLIDYAIDNGLKSISADTVNTYAA